MEKKFNFVYLTTNLVTGMQYVGEHSTNILNDGYLGSGKIIKSAIKKYGSKNFECEILEHFYNKVDAFSAQEKYIRQFNTLVPTGYNISPKGGANCLNGLSEKSLEQLKKTLSESLKGKPHNEKWNKNVSKSKKGKSFSNEHKLHLSESHKGKVPWMKGKFHSEETKKKISKAGKGRKHSEETKQKMKKRIPRNKGLKLK